jgi:plastocyanin
VSRALAALALVACLALASCGGDDDGGGTPPATTPAVSGGGGGGGEVRVSMKDIKFVPQNVTVKAGQTIKWTNDDPVAHTATARSGANFDSGTVQPGQSYSQKLTRPGRINYFCEIHPNQTGTITVSP